MTQVGTTWRLNVGLNYLCGTYLILIDVIPTDQYTSSEQYKSNTIVDRDLSPQEVGFATASSLILFISVFFFVGVPSCSTLLKPQPSITGMSVLETLWVTAHSWTVHEHMKEVNDPTLDNLCKAGMFEICLGDLHSSQSVGLSEADSKALLK